MFFVEYVSFMSTHVKSFGAKTRIIQEKNVITIAADTCGPFY